MNMPDFGAELSDDATEGSWTDDADLASGPIEGAWGQIPPCDVTLSPALPRDRSPNPPFRAGVSARGHTRAGRAENDWRLNSIPKLRIPGDFDSPEW